LLCVRSRSILKFAPAIAPKELQVKFAFEVKNIYVFNVFSYMAKEREEKVKCHRKEYNVTRKDRRRTVRYTTTV
jgi:hypothetical protein